jgi:hypothetical protein
MHLLVAEDMDASLSIGISFSLCLVEQLVIVWTNHIKLYQFIDPYEELADMFFFSYICLILMTNYHIRIL